MHTYNSLKYQRFNTNKNQAESYHKRIIEIVVTEIEAKMTKNHNYSVLFK